MRLIMNPGHAHIVFGKVVRAGDDFEVPDNEAEIWIKLGRARKRGPGRPPNRYSRADMRAEEGNE